MIDLENAAGFERLDEQGMLAHIDGLPDQMQAALELGGDLPLPAWEGIDRVLVAGMGGSAIGADLVCSYIAPFCRLPVMVHRNYDLPAWAHGARTLVIASSHSGNTEETLSAFARAQSNGCRLAAVTTGGRLAQAGAQSGVAVWQYRYHSQPRAAIGYTTVLLLVMLARLGIIPDPKPELHAAIQTMRSQQAWLRATIPAAKNPAKRMAGQLFGRWVTVFGADVLEPVARRWKAQINEIAKAWGQFEPMPEADHNLLAAVMNPVEALVHTMALFLRAPSYHPRNLLRTNLTKTAFMLEGLNTDFIDAQGDTPLAHQWSALHFGDYTAYYLAMAYGVDPTAIEAIESLKVEMLSQHGLG
jgi:glucose/mannose-6-phosphate isomerase